MIIRILIQKAILDKEIKAIMKQVTEHKDLEKRGKNRNYNILRIYSEDACTAIWNRQRGQEL